MKTISFNYRIEEKTPNSFCSSFGYGIIVIEPVKWIMASGINQCKRLHKKVILNCDDPELKARELIKIIKDDAEEGRQLVGRPVGFDTVYKGNGRYGYKYYTEKDYSRLKQFSDWLEKQIS